MSAISDEKHYEFVSSEVRNHSNKVFEVFGLYVRLLSAIIGGSIWLAIENAKGPYKANAERFVCLSDIFVGLLTILMIVMVVEHWRAWRSYRSLQSKLGGTDHSGNLKILGPRPTYKQCIEITMILTMLFVCALFWRFNPFSLVQ